MNWDGATLVGVTYAGPQLQRTPSIDCNRPRVRPSAGVEVESVAVGDRDGAAHQALYPDGVSYPRAKAHRQVPRALREQLARRGQALYGTAAEAAA